MLNLKKMIKSENGVFLFSIIIGLGVAGLFKMSCDSRSCIVYRAPDLSKTKQVKVNESCYKVTEEIIECNDKDKREKIYT